PRVHGRTQRHRRLARDHLCGGVDRQPSHRVRAAGARALGGATGSHSLRQFGRSRAGGLGALYAGIPFCPVSPAYSLISRDYGKLSYVMGLLTPGFVFIDNADRFADALKANVPEGTEIAASFGAVSGRSVTTLADLMATPLHPDLDAIHAEIGPDT